MTMNACAMAPPYGRGIGAVLGAMQKLLCFVLALMALSAFGAPSRMPLPSVVVAETDAENSAIAQPKP